MKRLEDLPLNKKLMAVMVLTSMAVVFFECGRL
jgi:hypothetical protein